VLSLSSSFKQSANQRVVPPSTESKFTLEEAVAIASKQLGVPRDDFPASQIFLQLPSGKVVYGHQFQLRDDKQEKWYQVVVDATNGQVVQVVDYVQQASYKALKLPKTDPTDGGFEVVSDPQNLATNASPKGWHDDGSKTYTTTKGNNVDSHVGTLFVDGQAALNFDHQWDGSKDPTTDENKKAAIVNNFYCKYCFNRSVQLSS
jgi:extracellular elastinolytic metalloproteinase